MDKSRTPLEALKALVVKLKQIEAHPSYRSVWVLADSHGFKYDGPNWKEEVDQAKVLLDDWEETIP